MRQPGVVVNSRFRSEVVERGGKAQFPYLEDPNTQAKMYESDQIIRYLLDTYGSSAQLPWNYRFINSSHWLMRQYNTLEIFVNRGLLRPLPQHGNLRVPSRPPREVRSFMSEVKPHSELQTTLIFSSTPVDSSIHQFFHPP